jgi:uncharacterized protein (TIGR03382 family)
MTARGSAFIVVGAALFVLVAGAARDARACSFSFDEHVIDPDEQAVDVGIVEVAETARGRRELEGDSCADIARIGLAFTPPVDDRTPREELGYRVDVVSGAAPPSIGPIGEAVRVRAAEGAATLELQLIFVDHGEQLDESFDFLLGVTAIDKAGNESPSSQVRVELAPVPPLPPEGCAATSAPAALPFVVVVGLAARRRSTSAR